MAPVLDHAGRLTLLGFVYGNGGSMTALKEFLRTRRMLKDTSSWKDLHTIERDLETNADFRNRSYYWDIIHGHMWNIEGTREIEPWRD